jgi:hypothetical protein
LRLMQLLTGVDPDAVAEVLRQGSAARLLHPFGDRYWAAAAQTPIGKLLAAQLQALEALDRETVFPILTKELYGQFSCTGERLPFERVYMERRRLLARWAVRLLLEPRSSDQGLWLQKLIGALEELLAEPSWAWPAHVRHPSGIDREAIDLFAAETANLCGDLVVVFAAVLPLDLVAGMQQRVAAMLQGFLGNPSAYWWGKATNNWNAVCHQGLVGAALALEPDPQRLATLLIQVSAGLQHFVAAWPEDGVCTEGITYWEYGFGWFSMLNQQIEAFTAGGLSLFEGCPKLEAMAGFGPSQLLSAGWLVNFADARLDMPPRPSLLCYLGERLGLKRCLQAGDRLYRQLVDSGFSLHGQRCDFLYLSRLLLQAPAAPGGDRAAGQDDLLDDLFPGTGVFVTRTRSSDGRLWELAAKGGHNGEHHNHNDCGGYLLHIDGHRLVAEIGAPEYTRQTFGPDRYDLLATRSFGHSLPLPDGCEQEVGAHFAAKVLKLQANQECFELELELAGCYGEPAGLISLVRRFVQQRRSGVLEVRDILKAERPMVLESGLIAIAGVSLHARGDGLVMISPGSSPGQAALSIRIEPLPGTLLAGVEVHPYRGHHGESASIQRVAWRAEAACQVTVGYRIEVSTDLSTDP